MPADMSPMEFGALRSDLENMRSLVEGISTKMDTLVTMQTTIVQLQERASAQQAAIDRAFTSIHEARQRADIAVTAINRSMAFVRGAAIVGTLLFAFAQWYVLQQLEDVKATKELVSISERRLGYIEARLWPDERPSSASGRNRQ